MQNLGERIKKKREFLGKSLKDMAVHLDVTSSLLSQIENGKAFPSLFTLKKIAETLNSSVGELIGENEPIVHNPVIRNSDKKLVKKSGSGSRLYLLSSNNLLYPTETFLIQINPEGTTENLMDSNAGFEICYVLKGKVEVSLKDKKYILEKDDSIYYLSANFHQIKNINKTNSEIFWVVLHH